MHARFADKSTEDLQLHEVSNAQHTDPQPSRVADYVHCGWPDSLEEVDDLAKPFWPTRHQLNLANPLTDHSLLLMNGRSVIPSSLQKKILLILHEGHQGIDKTRRRARDSVFWPGIDREIEDMIKRCHQCLSLLPANCKETLQQPPLPTRPWDKLGLDLCSLHGKEYLIITDYFSFFTEVRDLRKNTKAPIVIKELKEVFSRFGSPVEVVSDGGPQFSCKAFQDFAKEWGFQHTLSSPTHAQSNGKAEAAVKNVKKLLKKCGALNDEFWKGMLAIRNTPLSSGKSPAQLLLGRFLRESLPRLPNPKQEFLTPDIRRRILHNKSKEKRNYDQQSKGLSPLHLGSRVAIRSRTDTDWSLLGTILELRPHRTFLVPTDQGSVLIRNRRYLRPAH